MVYHYRAPRNPSKATYDRMVDAAKAESVRKAREQLVRLAARAEQLGRIEDAVEYRAQAAGLTFEKLSQEGR